MRILSIIAICLFSTAAMKSHRMSHHKRMMHKKMMHKKMMKRGNVESSARR